VKPAALCLSLACLLAIALPSHGDTGIAACGPNDDYVTLYYSLETFEMAARIPCGAKVAVLDDQRTYAAQHTPYVRVQTSEGKVGYLMRNAIAIVEAPAVPASAPTPSTLAPSRAAKSGRQSLALASSPIPPGAPVPPVPPAARAASTAAAPTSEVRVPNGTELKVKLSADLSSERTAEGAAIDFTVAQPFVSNGITIFAAGAPAHARIVQLKKAGHFGHEAEIYWKMEDVAAADGSLIPARFVNEAQDSEASGMAVGVLASAGNMQQSQQPSFSVHSREALIPAGKIYKVLVHGDAIIHTSPSAVAVAPAHP